jgi:hypothetical protein
MSIGSIGSGGSAFSDSGVGLSNEARLALMVLEQEDSQQDADRIEKGIARSEYISATNAEVEALKEEASDTRMGAFVQATATGVSAGLQFVDAWSEPCDAEVQDLAKGGKDASCNELLETLQSPPQEKPWGEIGAGLTGGMSAPLGKLFDAEVAEDRAEGKRAQQSAQLAEWDLSEAKDAIKESQQQQQKATEWLSANSSNEASTMSAIIAGFA